MTPSSAERLQLGDVELEHDPAPLVAVGVAERDLDAAGNLDERELVQDPEERDVIRKPLLHTGYGSPDAHRALVPALALLVRRCASSSPIASA